jgi:hypothetical protein
MTVKTEIKILKNQNDLVHLETSQGPAEARRVERDPQGDQWVIGYPWGDDRFFGGKPSLIARMRDTIRQKDEAAAA